VITENPHLRPRTGDLPRLRQRATALFRIVGETRRPMRCAIYAVPTGRELRLEYEETDDVLRSRLFAICDDGAVAELAEEWRRELIRKGFGELEVAIEGHSSAAVDELSTEQLQLIAESIARISQALRELDNYAVSGAQLALHPQIRRVCDIIAGLTQQIQQRRPAAPRIFADRRDEGEQTM